MNRSNFGRMTRMAPPDRDNVKGRKEKALTLPKPRKKSSGGYDPLADDSGVAPKGKKKMSPKLNPKATKAPAKKAMANVPKANRSPMMKTKPIKKTTTTRMKSGGKVRGCGIAKQGVRPAKMR